MKAITSAWPALNGVIQYSAAPTQAATKAPRNQARSEKLRLIWRATGRRRSQRLASSCDDLRHGGTRRPGRTAGRRRAPRSPGKSQQQQRRRMRQAVDADHDAPLDLGVALEEAVRVAGQRADHRQREEDVDRDEDGEQVEVARATITYCTRQHEEEGQDQRAVVAAPGVLQRDELAQREEGEQAEEQRRARPAPRTTPARTARVPTHTARRSRRKRSPRRAWRPARARAARSATRPAVSSSSAPNRITNSSATCSSTRQTGAGCRVSSLQAVRGRRREHGGRARDRGRSACLPRARAASARRRSPCTGSAPAPPRPWASRAARCRSRPGSAARAGNCSARWYRPLLKACGSPLLLRVPSGKMTSESPWRKRVGERLERVLVVGALSRHVDRVEDLARDPVLERGSRSSSRLAAIGRVVLRRSFGSAAQISTQSRWLWWLAK